MTRVHRVRRDGRPIEDWPDLLQPRLKGRVAFVESPRELVGVALKTLGLSFNSRLEDLDDAGVTLEQLEERLKALYGQVLFGIYTFICKVVLVGTAAHCQCKPPGVMGKRKKRAQAIRRRSSARNSCSRAWHGAAHRRTPNMRRAHHRHSFRYAVCSRHHMLRVRGAGQTVQPVRGAAGAGLRRRLGLDRLLGGAAPRGRQQQQRAPRRAGLGHGALGGSLGAAGRGGREGRGTGR